MKKVFCGNCVYLQWNGSRYMWECHHPSNVIKDIKTEPTWFSENIDVTFIFKEQPINMNAKNSCTKFKQI